MRKKKAVKKVIPYVILIVIAIAFLLPLLWLVFAAFNPQASQAFSIPKSISMENFRAILSESRNQRGFLNSLLISVSQTMIVLVCSLLAAYPLSRYELRMGQKITMGMLFLTSIPITAVMVPVYQLFIMMKLVDSLGGTIIFLSASSLPYGIWMMKNFLDGVSVDLEEAAWIDGASAVKSVIYVVLPLMLPGLFTVAMFTFVGSWGNFFVPLILLQSTDKIPASVNIYRFFGEHGAVIYGQLAAYSIIYMLPVFVLYFFSQNYMSRGFVMSGAAKG
ncbi:MAG TPA: carbohydrate ABC transporter permease [Candidatus Pullilachnospira intestinigallinarum]|nr:carbohydrate ABC transporter permease [Candidatus Pullilachnospira intestinigallinarum]